jgi:hypothetical protein
MTTPSTPTSSKQVELNRHMYLYVFPMSVCVCVCVSVCVCVCVSSSRQSSRHDCSNGATRDHWICCCCCCSPPPGSAQLGFFLPPARKMKQRCQFLEKNWEITRGHHTGSRKQKKNWVLVICITILHDCMTVICMNSLHEQGFHAAPARGRMRESTKFWALIFGEH